MNSRSLEKPDVEDMVRKVPRTQHLRLAVHGPHNDKVASSSRPPVICAGLAILERTIIALSHFCGNTIWIFLLV